MRITNKMMADNSIGYMNDNLDRLNSLQDKVSSGKQFQGMSDDPAKAASALSLRSSLKISQNYIDNDQVVNDWLSANDQALQSMTDLGTKASNLVLQGINDTNSLSERTAMANQIDQMIDHAVMIANTNDQGKYIFAGFNSKSAAPPFTLNAARNAVTSTADTHSIQVDIAPGQSMTTNFVGTTVFNQFFGALVTARDALLSNNSTNISAAKGTLDAAIDPVTTALTTNGGRQSQLGQLMDSMTAAQASLKSLLSSKEDVNMADAISQMRTQETTYQAVIDVSQRVLSTMTLFDRM
jgi:flagellar hook-associated protein 3 FlgL